jgi:hypothetical protein
MTYREAFDHLGRPRHPSPTKRHRAALARWMAVVAVILVWASLVGWMDGAA